MNKRAIIFILMIGFVSLLCCSDAFAELPGAWFGTGTGSTASGNYQEGGSCTDKNHPEYNQYVISCSGVSWIKYKASSETDAYESIEPYFMTTGSVNGSIDPTCSKKVGDITPDVWHFGINGYNIWFGYWNGWQIGANKQPGEEGVFTGHWTTLVWGYYAEHASIIPYNTGVAPNQSIGVYNAVEYGSPERVLEEYNKALKQANPNASPVSALPSNLYAFCSWPGGYYGKSVATANGSTSNSGIAPKDSETKKEDAVVSIKVNSNTVNETIYIDFLHNIYSEGKDGEVYWGVYRDDSLTTDGTGYKINSNNYTSKSSYKPKTITKFIDYKEDNYYVTNRNGYVLKDTATITFTAAGEYTFCETLKMAEKDQSSGLDSAKFTTKACVVVKVEAKEETTGCPNIDYTNTSYVLSRVKNPRLTGTYSGWKGDLNYSTETDGKNVVYARPDDRVMWNNCYYPGAQANASKTITVSWGETTNCSCPADNKVFSEAKSFGHQFEVSTDSPFGLNGNSWSIANPFVSLYTSGGLTVGDTSVKEKNNNYIVEVDKIGKTFNDKIDTVSSVPTYTKVSSSTHTDYCYVPCGESVCGGTYPHTVYDWEYESGLLASQSYVKIPYNFENSVSLDISGDNGVVYAGETASVNSFKVNVNTRDNKVVEAKYATKVTGAKVELLAYVSSSDQTGISQYERNNNGDGACQYVSYDHGLCDTVQSYSGNLNSGESGDTANWKSGKQYSGSIRGKAFNGPYAVFDAKAGDYFCMTVAMYPASSGSDDKQMDSRGSNTWLIASPKCIVIAKKPSLQVWGGGAYTVGSVSTSVSQKNSLYPNTSSFSYSGPGGTTVFGSWIEQELIVSGSVTNTASGAGLAKNKNSSAGFGINGGIGSKFCSDLVALTIANNIGGSCGNGAIGHSGVGTTTKNIAALLDYFEQFTNMSSEPSYGRFGYYITKYSETGKSIQYYHITDDDTVLSDTDQSITNGNADITSNTVVVKAENSIRIDHNIYVVGNASTLGQVSQVIIYAAGDIKINCGVDRIDAVLISAGTIDTCYNGGDINSEARSNQLTINGVVIAKKLTLGRTYGNSMGLANGGYILKKGIGAQPDTVRHTVPGSETPAEIINYDASLLLWGEGMASAEESDTFTVTYQHELAPRY